MHQQIVVVPKIDIRDLLRDQTLKLGINLAARAFVNLPATSVNQCINSRIRIVAAIGAVRRKLLRVEDVFKNIRIFVAADPAQAVQLEQSVSNIGKEGREFKGANIECDSDLP